MIPSIPLLRNWILPFILVAGLFLTASCQQPDSTHPPLVVRIVEPAPDTLLTVRISVIGDIMCHSPQFKLAKVGEDTFDFRPCFAEVAPFLAAADYTIGNLETNLGGKDMRYSGYPQFNTPDDILDALDMCGFDFLVTSNNHSMDKGEKGLLRTLGKLDKYGFAHTGTFESQSDRDSIRIVDIKGITMAILNYTYGTNGLPVPEGKPWMVNPIDTALIRRDILAAKALKPDLVTVFFHWGLEYKHEPSAVQKSLTQHSIENGADIILGSHPHVIQQADFFKTKGATLDTGFVIYSMGNFISNQNRRYTTAGVIVNLELTKNLLTDSLFISDVSYVPTFVYRGTDEKKKIHVILPAEDGFAKDSIYAFVDSAEKEKMKQAFQDTEKYINLYSAIRLQKLPPKVEEKIEKEEKVPEETVDLPEPPKGPLQLQKEK